MSKQPDFKTNSIQDKFASCGFKIALNGLLIVNKQEVRACSILSYQWTKDQKVNKCCENQLYLFPVKLIACQIL